jgi:hypothetical protein
MNIDTSDSDSSWAISAMDIDSSGNIILLKNLQVQKVNEQLSTIKRLQGTLRSQNDLLGCVLNR